MTDMDVANVGRSDAGQAEEPALSDRDREILRLRFEEDMTQTEISERIGVSQMQVSRLIRQALARLRLDIESAKRRRISAA